MSIVTQPSGHGDPPWEIALLFPPQGEWTEEEYLGLPTNRLVEFSDGFLEVLPMPTLSHQAIVRFLFLALDAFVVANALGKVFFAPLPVRLWSKKYREPDLVFLKPHRYRDMSKQPGGADLVMEVVSEGEANRKRDLEIKPREYARAGIAEYWIIDPEAKQITVMVLEGGQYRQHGVFGAGDTATSVLLGGFGVKVAEVFGA